MLEKQSIEVESNAQLEGLTDSIHNQILNNFDYYYAMLELIVKFSLQDMESTPGIYAHISQQLLDVVNQHPQFDQLRYIDSETNERIRINRDSGDVYIVPPEQLQNKGDRYYFAEAVAQPLWSLYVSPIDLNIENGKIEEPWMPTI